MKSKIHRYICILSVPVLLAFASSQANATVYFFSQSGYTGGGTITGSFDAVDTDLDGQISSFFGEVTSFSMSFSGDSIVGSFTHTLSDLFGLVYDIGSGYIGDGSSGSVEGLASNWGGAFGFDYASGLGPTGGFGGRVIDIASGATSSTVELIAVVPEPETYAMLLAGLGMIGFMTHRRRNGSA